MSKQSSKRSAQQQARCACIYFLRARAAPRSYSRARHRTGTRNGTWHHGTRTRHLEQETAMCENRTMGNRVRPNRRCVRAIVVAIATGRPWQARVKFYCESSVARWWLKVKPREY